MADVPRGLAAAIKEYIVPQFEGLRAEVKIIGGQQEQMSKRLDDMSAQLVALHARLDQTNARIDAVREELSARADQTGARIDQTNVRIEALREQLASRFETAHSETRRELDERTAAMNQRLDRLYEVVVRRDEHDAVERRLAALEAAVSELRQAS